MRPERLFNLQAVSVGLVMLSVAACTAVSNVPNPRAYMVDRGTGSHVWVAGPDKQLVELTHARVDQDTLSGFSGSQYYEIAMSDVTQMRASLPSPGRTALAVGAIVVGAGAVVAELTSTGSTAGCTTTSGASTGGQLYPGGPNISAGIAVPCGAATTNSLVK